MPRTFSFKLEPPHTFYCLSGGAALLDEYLDNISFHLRVRKERVKRDVNAVIPDSVSKRVQGDCDFFDVAAATLEDAMQTMRDFAERFKQLVGNYTRHPGEVNRYGTLRYVPSFYEQICPREARSEQLQTTRS